jgi:histidine decarboxylase
MNGSQPSEFAWLDRAAALDNPDIDVHRVTNGLRRQRDAGEFFHRGYPVATDTWTELRRLDLGPGLWNNIGSPSTNSPGGNHTKPVERALIDWAGTLFGFPPGDRWGYATLGGTEGNRAGLHAARNIFPRNAYGVTTALVYYSASAHYSIPKCLEMLVMPGVQVRSDAYGEMDYDHLDDLLARHGDRPAIVVATVGTTMTEAVDDLTTINAALDRHRIRQRHVHVDAALSGIPLALDGALDLDRVDSIAVSGYKFLGVDRVCGIVLGRHREQHDEPLVAYTDTLDGTLSGSRDGEPAYKMWYVVATRGNAGLRERSHDARRLAEYAVGQIKAAGWDAWRHPHAFTVVFPTPPPLVRPWAVPTADGLSHLITMPGTTEEHIAAYARDLRIAARGDPPATIPRLRREIPTVALPS